MTRPVVAVTRPMPFPAIERLAAHAELRRRESDAPMSPEELVEFSRGATALLSTLADPLPESVLAALAPPLRVVATFAVGYDNVDVAAAARLGVVVANTPDVLTDATADLTFGILLALTRRIVEGDELLRSGGFGGWSPTFLLGRDLSGKTLGIVGYGRIGRAVGRRAEAFGMRVVFTSRRDVAGEGSARRVNLDELLASSDVVTLHAPATPETTNLLDEAALRRMKRGSFLINTARGALVDEKAVARLLGEGHLAGAGFDVYRGEPEVDPALLEAPNTVLVPHLGSATVETRAAMAGMCVDAILDVLDGRVPKHVVEGKR